MRAGCTGAVLLCVWGMIYTPATVQGFYDHRTYFTFTRAVELPGGITLQPGKYTFRLADFWANRYIVEVFDKHETQMFGKVFAVDPSDEAVIMFGETPPGAPQPIRYWYHSSRTVGPIGYEFVYSKDQAIRIAKATNQRVLMTNAPAVDADALKRAQLYIVSPIGATMEYRENVLTRSRSIASAATTPEETRPVPQGFDLARSDPPQVHGFQSLIGLIGLMLLGSAVVALRFHARWNG
jgi:hypothetical protein